MVPHSGFDLHFSDNAKNRVYELSMTAVLSLDSTLESPEDFLNTMMAGISDLIDS